MTFTPSQAETKRQQAVAFLRRIGKEDDADRFEAMDAEEYAESKGAELIANPQLYSGKERSNMARGKSKVEVESELDEANNYIEQLEAKLDDIVGIADDEDDDDSDDDNNDDDSGESLD